MVNVLLQELERYTGVVIFATNLAANFDPAFERRIRTHVLFELPGETERAQIWKAQLHPFRTPLAPTSISTPLRTATKSAAETSKMLC